MDDGFSIIKFIWRFIVVVMAIGIFLTFRILDIADMTAEGAFPLGAAVVASQIQAGQNPWLATLFSI